MVSTRKKNRFFMPIHRYRTGIDEGISRTLDEWMCKQDVPLLSDAVERIRQSVAKGKRIRGGLALLSHELFGGRDTQNALFLATGLELGHGAFLIHDDVMDNGAVRHGAPTVIAQYHMDAVERGFADERSYATGMAISAGDIAFLLAASVISSIRNKHAEGAMVYAYVLGEWVRTASGQMQDVKLAADSDDPTRQAVESCYLNKTARYTFSLPLAAGAMLAGVDMKTIRLLERFGESAGLIYQIRDDELSLFGRGAVVGKETGSDIAEGKKTLHYALLSKELSASRWKAIKTQFGSPAQTSVPRVREAVVSSGVQSEVERFVGVHKKKATGILNLLPLKDDAKTMLLQILSDAYERDR